MTAALDGVPMDTFAIRLAVVRAVMGWNYDQAARATGVGSETWRTWEKGTRRCTDIVGASSRISEGTDGVISRDWLILGGALAQEPAPVRDLPHRRRDSGGPRDAAHVSTDSVTSRYRQSRALVTARRVRDVRDEWRISRVPGSHELPIVLRRHAGDTNRCRRVAA
jgi:hypothetical protein